MGHICIKYVNSFYTFFFQQYIILVSDSNAKEWEDEEEKKNDRTSSTQEWKRRIQILLNVKMLFITWKVHRMANDQFGKKGRRRERGRKGKIGMKWNAWNYRIIYPRWYIRPLNRKRKRIKEREEKFPEEPLYIYISTYK